MHILELIKLIAEEVEIFEEFLNALERQQEALVANDLELLNQSTGELERLTLRTREIEQRREQLVAAVSEEHDLDRDGLNISQLSQLVSDTEAGELKKLQSTLLDLHEQIMLSKSRNEFLIRKSMEYVDNTLTEITGDRRQENYVPGQGTKRHRSLSLDHRA
jgi:hypothetical protein